jgi:hypothetical protein
MEKGCILLNLYKDRFTIMYVRFRLISQLKSFKSAVKINYQKYFPVQTILHS